MTCEHFQAQMLDHLYDLLEPTEKAALETHVGSCPACEQALRQAEGQRDLLAAAARTDFKEVTFSKPSETRPAVLLPRRSAGISVGPWALAASILLLIGVFGLVPGGLYVAGRAQQQAALQEAQAHQAAVTAERERVHEPIRKASDEVARLRSEANRVAEKYAEQVGAIEREVLKKHVALNIAVPQRYEPGAPNPVHILATDLTSEPAAVNLRARVLDGTQEVLAEASVSRLGDGEYRIALPPDLPLRPDAQPKLEILARNVLGVESRLIEPLSLAAPVYITHVATDKPMYQPGEQVRFRSLTLERSTLRPAALPNGEPFRLMYTIANGRGEVVAELAGIDQLNDASGQPILGPDKKPIRGLGAGEWQIPPDAAGGEYTLTVNEQLGRFPEQQRKFIVNKYEKPRLKKELEYARKSYGPGDEVIAACKVSPAEGGNAVANQPVEATVLIDGKTYDAEGKEGGTISLKTDSAGAVAVRFKLPMEIERGEASLSVIFTDGGNTETLVRPIPIVLKKLNVELFPEGGDLIAGVENTCYFQVRTTLDKPAELTARLLDEAGKPVLFQGKPVVLETLNDAENPGANQGMGAFTFLPARGGKYRLEAVNPSGVSLAYQFPAIKDDGVVMHVAKGVLGDKDPVVVDVHSTGAERRLLVGAYCRGRLLAQKIVNARPGEPARIELQPEAGMGGVYRVTVFQEVKDAGRWQPVAERLIYRHPHEKLNVRMEPSRKKYMPGERAALVLDAVDETGKPAPSIWMLAVVDKSVLTLADEKTHRVMPTHFFLTHEVKKPEDLEHADFLLTDHPKAALALDLLLGTQGWRRFAEQNPAEFEEKQGEEAYRYLATTGQSLAPASNLHVLLPRVQEEFNAASAKAAEEFNRQQAALAEQLTKAEQRLDQVQNSPELRQQLRAVDSELAAAARERADLERRLGTYDREWGLLASGLGGLALLVTALLFGGVGMLKSGPGRMPYFTVAGFALISIGIGSLWVLSGGLAPHSERMLAQADASRPTSETAQAEPWGADHLGDPQDRGGAVPADNWGFEAQREGFAKALAAPRREVPPAPPVMGPGGVPPAGGNVNENRVLGLPAVQDKPEGDQLNRQPKDADAILEFRARGAAKEDAAAREFRRKVDGARLPEEVQRQQAGRGLAEQKQLEAAKARLQAQAEAGAAKKAEENLDLMLKGERFKELAEEARDRLAVPQNRPAAGFGAAPPGLPKLRFAEPAKPNAAAMLDKRAMNWDKLSGIGGGRGGFEGAAGGLGGLAPGGGFGFAGGGGQGAPNQFHFFLGAGEVPGQPAVVPPPPPPLVVREYAHRRSLGQTGARTDFAETLFWQPALVLPNGSGKVEFDLCDSVTTFQATAYGHTRDGRIGSGVFTFESKLPFTIEPKIPIEVTASDRIEIPVTIANDTDDRRNVKLNVDAVGLKLEGSSEVALAVDANQRRRQTLTFRPTLVEGQAELALAGRSEPLSSDRIVRNIAVVPEGFPIVGSHSDLLEKVARKEVLLPESWVKGTLKLSVNVYPSTLADLQKGLEALLREPCGCFEQTSTSSYPNVLILDYLKEADLAKPEIAARARELIERGYGRLTSFECTNVAKKNVKEGYEWFGGTAPAHEALTAYGVLQFRDMSRVYNVDPAMLERTRTYLMARRDGKGGFERNPRALDTFGRAPDDITNAYIVWALTESGKDDDLSREIDALKAQAKTSQDPYFLALVGNVLINRDQRNEATNLLQKMAQAQKEDGHLDAASTSITGSGGRDLQIETTALALLAWLKSNQPEFHLAANKAVKWIGQQRGGHGGFGSTQSTILALKALIAHTRANKKTAEAGTLKLFVADREVASADFPAGAQEAISLSLPNADEVLRPGKNDVCVEITGNNAFPFTLTWSYQTLKPASAEGCSVKLSTKLDRNNAAEGDTVRLGVTVENVSGKGQGMTVAIIGLPAGLTLPEDFKQLKDYARLTEDGAKPGKIAAWETRGRELILYWRDLAPDAKIELPIDLICRVPGQYRGPASRAYLYYNADAKHWADPLEVTIQAR